VSFPERPQKSTPANAEVLGIMTIYGIAASFNQSKRANSMCSYNKDIELCVFPACLFHGVHLPFSEFETIIFAFGTFVKRFYHFVTDLYLKSVQISNSTAPLSSR
jgi:hypothetical protein